MRPRHLLPLLALGCAASKPPEPPSFFPSPDKLQALEATPATEFFQRGRYRDVESWDLVGPFPGDERNLRRVAETPWDRMLDDAADSRIDTVATTAMHCAAREMGIFQLKNSANPVPALQAFILSRCGARVPDLQLHILTGDVDISIPDERVYTDWYDKLIDLMYKLPNDPHQSIGLWYGRQGTRALFFMVSGQTLAALTSSSTTTAPNKYRFEGTVFYETSAIRALVNRGHFGVEECEISEERLPVFAVECEASLEDPYAWVEIVAFSGGRIVGTTILNEMVFPQGTAIDRYVRASVGDNKTIESAEDITNGLLATANQIRKTAGMGPLVLDRPQSTVSTQLAGHYFGDTLGKRPTDVANTIALGVRAGWNVEGVVRYGKLTAAALTGDATIGLLASSAIERPFNREVLLDPSVQRIAIGPMHVPGEQFQGAVISTYAVLTPELVQSAAARVMKLLADKREEGHKGEMRPLPLSNVPKLAEQTILSGELGPRDALKRFINNASHKLNRHMDGWVVEATELEALELPEDLFESGTLEVSIAVSYRKPAGDPWARYVVLIITPSPEENEVRLKRQRKVLESHNHHRTTDVDAFAEARFEKKFGDPLQLPPFLVMRP